jgi:hypothetical protein
VPPPVDYTNVNMGGASAAASAAGDAASADHYLSTPEGQAWQAGQGSGAAGAAAAASAAGDAASTAKHNNDLNTFTNTTVPTKPPSGLTTYVPTSSTFDPAASGLFSEPGAYETWLKANMPKLDTPGAVENLYGTGLQNGLNNSPLNNLSPADAGAYQAWLAGGGANGPTGANSSANLLGQALNPNASANVLGSLSGGPSGGPSAGSSASVLGSLSTGPSNATDVYNQARGTLSGPGALETRFAQDGDAFDQQGAYENAFDTSGGSFDAPGAFETAYAGGNPFDQQGAYETAFQQHGADFNTPNAYEAFYGKYGDDPMQKSYTENLYEQGIGQLDPYYDYAEKRALDTAQNRSAARGGFNSGLAAQQESDVTSNIRGAQAKQWVDLAPIADATKLARYNQGSNFAKTDADEMSQRIRDLFSTAQGEDTSFANRQNNRFGLAQNEDTSMRDRILAKFGIAKGQDDAYSQRILNSFGLADMTQKATNDRFDTLSGISARGDASDTARDNTRVNAAGNADQAAIDAFSSEWNARNNAESNRVTAAGNTDRSAIDAYSAKGTVAGNADRNAIDAFSATQDANLQGSRLALDTGRLGLDTATAQDAANRANINSQFNIAGQQDNSALGRLTTQGGMANDLQTTAQDRLSGGLNAIAGLDARQSALVTQIYGDMKDVDATDEAALQALAQKYGIPLQQMKDAAAAKGKGLAGVGAIIGAFV